MGKSATCATRINYGATHRFAGRQNACDLAHGAVTAQCPFCATCELSTVGCVSGPLKPFDCKAGLAHWTTGWSHAKKIWCCYNEGTGCMTTSLPYDCDAGYLNWAQGWSDGKKKWCCKRQARGCETTSKPYDCKAGYSNWATGWSASKKVWCCKHEARGCEAPDANGAEAAVDQAAVPARAALAQTPVGLSRLPTSLDDHVPFSKPTLSSITDVHGLLAFSGCMLCAVVFVVLRHRPRPRAHSASRSAYRELPDRTVVVMEQN